MSGAKSLLVVAIMISAACGDSDEQQSTAADTASSEMSGMGGMTDMSGSQSMMQDMRSHMQMMETARADSLPAMARRHRQMAANMLAQMNREMDQMNMAADAKWNALADSVRQDLTRMPEWASAELQSALSAHMGRMRRLMEMHDTMMRH